MEFRDVVNNRRSIRKYKSNKIEKNVIDSILEDAILSPSAHNRQPWHYYVCMGEEKTKIEDIILKQLNEKDELSYYEKIMRKDIEFIKEAPVFILCYIEKENSAQQDLLSMGSSIEHINLSAVDKGLSTVWVGVIVPFEEEISKYLKIEDKMLVSSIVLGYKDENPEKKPRKKLDEVVTYL